MWLLKINLPYGNTYECYFASEVEAMIEHMYLHSQGLDVKDYTIKGVMNGTN
jgi:hypothetical protein